MHNSVINSSSKGWLYGIAGVIIFAGSLPATRIAVMGFTPEFLTAARAAIAGVLAIFCILFFSRKIPSVQQFYRLAIVCLGVVIGFPLFTAQALQTVTSAHAIVFIALLPLCTAIFAVFRAAEKPSPAFWCFAILGSALVIAFTLYENKALSFSKGDIYMILAVIVCGLGYAEGGQLSRNLGGWQVICWALIIALPVMLVFSMYYFPDHLSQISISQWSGLAYVSLFSMLIGFFFWYKGLALGGIATVGQAQLLQPFIGLGFAAVLLNEHVSTGMLIVSCAVICCVAMAKKVA